MTEAPVSESVGIDRVVMDVFVAFIGILFCTTAGVYYARKAIQAVEQQDRWAYGAFSLFCSICDGGTIYLIQMQIQRTPHAK